MAYYVYRKEMTCIDNRLFLDKDTVTFVKCSRGDSDDLIDVAFLRGNYQLRIVARGSHEVGDFVQDIPGDSDSMEDFSDRNQQI